MSTPDSTPTSRRGQIAQTYRMAKRSDPRLGWIILGTFLVGAALGFGLMWVLPGEGVISLVISIVGALMIGLLLTMLVFGRRAQAAAYKQMEGQPAAAAGALQMLRRGWKLDPVVGFTKQQDVVHRVVGPPGIVLVGEGTSPNRVRQLLVTERKKHERVAYGVPIGEVVQPSAVEGQQRRDQQERQHGAHECAEQADRPRRIVVAHDPDPGEQLA